jgi:hypothetical protein
VSRTAPPTRTRPLLNARRQMWSTAGAASAADSAASTGEIAVKSNYEFRMMKDETSFFFHPS